MAFSLGTVTAFLRVNASSFTRGVQDAANDAQTQTGRISKVTKNMADDIKGALKQAAGAFAVMKIAEFFGDTVKAASDLAESTNKVSQVFKTSTPEILDFTSTTAKGFGISNVAARDAAATFGVFGQSAGLAGKDLSDFSIKLVGLAGDLASFYNTSPADAIRGIASALRGESEPIRAYGVLLNEVTLRTEGVKLGLIATTKEALTPQQRVLAAYNVILAQTSVAQGDFSRTSHLLANQMRITGASFEDTKASIGNALLPIATQFFGIVQTVGLPALEGLGKAFTGLISVFSPVLAILGDVIGIISNLPTPILAGAAAFGAFLLLRGPLAAMLVSAGGGLANMGIQATFAAARIAGATGVLATTAAVASVASRALLLAFGGPIGLAITAITVGLGFLFSSMQDNADAANTHAAAIDSVVNSLDAETGAVTRNTRAQIVDKLEKAGLLAKLQELGIASDQYVDAILQQGDATETTSTQLKANAAAALDSSKAYKDLKPALDAAGISQEEFIDALASGDMDAIKTKLGAYGDTASAAADDTSGLAVAGQVLNNAGIDKTVDQLTAAAGPAAGLLAQMGVETGVVGEASDSAARKLEAMGDATYDAQGNITGYSGAADEATDPVEKLGDATKELEGAANEADVATKFLIASLNAMNGGAVNAQLAMDTTAAAVRSAGNAHHELESAQDGVTESAINVTKAEQDLKEAQDNLGKSQEEGGTTAEDVTLKQLALNDAHREAEEATGKVAAAEENLREQNLKARDAAIAQATASYALTAATGDLDGASVAMTGAINNAKAAFIAAQPQADILSGKAQATADSLFNIPDDTLAQIRESGATNVQLQAGSTTGAINGIPGGHNTDVRASGVGSGYFDDIGASVNGIPSTRTVNILLNYQQTGASPGATGIGLADGGTIHAANGLLFGRGISQVRRGMGEGVTWAEAITNKEYYLSMKASMRKRNQWLAAAAVNELGGVAYFGDKKFANGAVAGGRGSSTPGPLLVDSGGNMTITLRGDGILRQLIEETAEIVVDRKLNAQGRQMQFGR